MIFIAATAKFFVFISVSSLYSNLCQTITAKNEKELSTRNYRSLIWLSREIFTRAGRPHLETRDVGDESTLFQMTATNILLTMIQAQCTKDSKQSPIPRGRLLESSQASRLYNLQVLFQIVCASFSGFSFRTSASFNRTDLTKAGSFRRQ